MASPYDGHMSKRQRTDDTGRGVHTGSNEKFDDPHKPQPSTVVHVRGICEMVIEEDIVEAVRHFGDVNYVMMMPRRRQALIEFADIASARSCVNYSMNNTIYVGGQPAFFNFSTSQRIERNIFNGPADAQPANHILLMTILAPKYPINVDVIHTITKKFGQVQRIVIFKKNGVQCMVEFDGIESAKRAKDALNGADIYSGCCTLKIEYAKPNRLNVLRNDHDSWDYTRENETIPPPRQRPAPLLADPSYGGPATPYDRMDMGEGSGMDMGGSGGMSMGMGRSPGMGMGRGPRSGMASAGHSSGYNGPSMQYEHSGQGDYDSWGAPSQPPRQQSGRYGGSHDDYGYGGQPGPQGGSDYYGPPHSSYPDEAVVSRPLLGGSQQGAVVMVYGINLERLNCDNLFNLFCLYGNVVRVKFLKSKDGSAMVQMGDTYALERVIYHLGGTVCFEKKLQLSHSKQAFLQDMVNPYELPDGTPSFKDYTGSRNNRFTNPTSAQKNRIQGPTKIVHYFNAPPTLTEEELQQVFVDAGAKPPGRVKKFPQKSEKSSHGLMEFENRSDATEGIALVNHNEVENPDGKAPFVLKLCFSSTQILS